MKMYWGDGGTTTCILNLSTRLEVSGQLQVLATLPWGKSPGIHWIGDWVGPRAGLGVVAKKEIPDPAGNQTSVAQPIA
jgi:hypothetical protein